MVKNMNEKTIKLYIRLLEERMDILVADRDKNYNLQIKASKDMNDSDECLNKYITYREVVARIDGVMGSLENVMEELKEYFLEEE